MPNFRDMVCPKIIAKESRLQKKRKSIFDAAETIGRIEALNDFGVVGGRVRQGLETLAEASDAIRIGATAADAEGVLDESGNGLMDEIGIGQSVINTITSFDPGAVNGAVGAAKSFIASARQGTFTVDDIPNAIAEFKNIAQIANKIFTPPASGGSDNADYQRFKCRPSPYALDLVTRAPKQNFQFVVEIELHPAYREYFLQSQIANAPNSRPLAGRSNPSTATNDILAKELAFLVQTSERPSISYDYEELNYYNYRTQGIRKATYNPLNMTFIDDQLNNAISFYAFYLSAMSPIANIPHSRKSNNSELAKNYEQRGIDFRDFDASIIGSDSTANSFPAYAATVGALRPTTANGTNNTRNIIERISIYQYGKNGNTFTGWNMFYPKITSFTPSELTMRDSGDGQMLSMEITYDYFNIIPEIIIDRTKLYSDSVEITADDVSSLTGADIGAVFANRFFGPDDAAASSNVGTGNGSFISAAGQEITQVPTALQSGDGTPVTSGDGTPVTTGTTTQAVQGDPSAVTPDIVQTNGVSRNRSFIVTPIDNS